MTETAQTVLLGADLVVALEDGKTMSVHVRQIRLRDYQRALLAVGDEFAFTALACDSSVEWVQTLAPESYERLQAEARRVNADFFAWFARRCQDLVSQFPPQVLQEWLKASSGMASPKSSSKPGGL